MYISDIPPAVEEVYGNIPQEPQARGVYSHKPPNTSRWYITDIHRLAMVHILYIMLNFDEVYISDIPPAVSIAIWYISVDWDYRLLQGDQILICRLSLWLSEIRATYVHVYNTKRLLT